MKAFEFASWCVIVSAVLPAVAATPADDASPYRASADAGSVQRVALVGGSYFFQPDHIVVQAGQPLEISVKVEPGIVPHSFVLETADGKRLAEMSLGEEPKTLRFNLPAGHYVFYCSKRLLGFKSHRERGMAGELDARE